MSGVNLSSKTNSISSSNNSKPVDYNVEWSSNRNTYGRIKASWFRGEETVYVKDVEDIEGKGHLEILYRDTRLGPGESYGRFNDESDLAAKIEDEFGFEIRAEDIL